MKKLLLLILSCIAVALAVAGTLLPASFAVASPAVAADAEEPKEFYFTRMIYSGGRGGRGGGRGGGGGRQADTSLNGEKICGDAASMAARHQGGGGWGTDYPEADCKFMWGVERMTNLSIHKEPHAIRIMDENLFDYPFIYAVEVGQMDLSDEEAKRLREYLDRGGFWWCDDFWGLDQWDRFAENMAKVFPEHAQELSDPRKSALEITPKHESFHTFFDIETVMQIPNISNGTRYTRNNGQGQTWEQASDTDPRVFGVSDAKGRMKVLVTYNSDLGDAWEHMDNPEYPEKFSGQAYRMGMNFIIFGMTH